MRQFFTWCLFLAGLLFNLTVAGQETKPLSFSYSYERLNDQEVLLTIKARLSETGKLYSITKVSDDALYSTVLFDTAVTSYLKDGVVEKGNIQSEKDATLDGLQVSFSTDSVEWQQKVTLPAGEQKAFEGKVNYLVKSGEEFKSGEEAFTISVKAETAAAGGTAEAGAEGAESNSLWSFFLGGLAAGLGAFIMPCIYAMVPVTVSFFTKRSTTRKEGIRNALVYSGSIIGIFTLLGFLITLIFGPGALNSMASSAVFNVFVFAMFVIFGVAFLGAFEITLPASWSNKMDSKANFGSISGIFFMALTLVIVSFSCTVPFIGLLTVWTAKGGMLAPLVGFLGFSFALSLPFALFAFFPALLNKMGKSGGWLNTVKVSLGFIELALALKFLSSADLAYHWGILDREVYLSLWIVIFGLLGLYLLGKLKFHHDDDLPSNDYGKPYLTVTRLFFAIAALSFTIYLVPGLWGAPLKGISAWLPEMKTQDFNLNKVSVIQESTTGGDLGVKPVKYTDILESEIPGVEAFFDYEEAIAAAKKLKRPVLIDFTGHSCANCRKMEQEVLTDPEVTKRLKNDFVVVSLYVDDKYKLQDSEWYESKHTGRMIKNMGDKNLDFEVTLTGNSAQPLYVFVDHDGVIIKDAGGYNSNIKRFIDILDGVKASYAEKHKK
ncbi:MAG: thioredoxin family protein [Candidatus Pseudobacter hemicellulosilyticus]|uniref:Thioredoxin family protein n=1 Tax=Candidatus Pseudobacter hemicellulosilyticus TaxID=3121375 RepID=A0AAJ5WT44_9BACT|nr:MAG: thioredoxin family protein [Pseudobacter sp.]